MKNSFNNIKTTKINTSIYSISRNGRIFQAEKTEDNQWQLCEITNSQIYINHYFDLTSCKILINDYFNTL
jgi:hypothetical protein